MARFPAASVKEYVTIVVCPTGKVSEGFAVWVTVTALVSSTAVGSVQVTATSWAIPAGTESVMSPGQLEMTGGVLSTTVTTMWIWCTCDKNRFHAIYFES